MAASSRIVSAAVAVMFFVTIIIAAMTSSISLLEVGVAYFVEEKKMKRPLAALVVFVIAWLLGLSSVFSQKAFGLIDAFSSNILLVAGAMMAVLFVGWKMKRRDVEEEINNGESSSARGMLFNVVYFLIRYVSPVAIMIIFFSNFIL